MVVAIIALFVAASGSAVAASRMFNGDRLIRKHTLSGNRLRNHTLTGTQINMGKLGKVPNARHADRAGFASSANFATNAGVASNATVAANATDASHATNADNATHATNADNATTAANLTGLTRFIKTVAPSGTNAATAAVVSLGTSGPLTVEGKCWTNSGAITANVFLSTTAAGEYNAYYYNGGHGAALTPGTDVEVGNNEASATPPAVAFEDPSDGTFAAITNNTSNYITGLVSAGANLNNSGDCTFAGFTSAS